MEGGERAARGKWGLALKTLSGVIKRVLQEVRKALLEGKLGKLFYQAFCLLEQMSVRDNKTPVADLIKEASAKAGGQLKVERFARYQLGE
jgi:translation elongation factor EF-Ts